MSPTGYPDYPTSLNKCPQFRLLKPPIGYFELIVNFLSIIPTNVHGPNYHNHPVIVGFLIQSLSGCFGDDQQTTDYDGPIDLIVYYAVTNGTIQKSVNNGNNGPTTGVEINFDLYNNLECRGYRHHFP